MVRLLYRSIQRFLQHLRGHIDDCTFQCVVINFYVPLLLSLTSLDGSSVPIEVPNITPMLDYFFAGVSDNPIHFPDSNGVDCF